MNKRMILLCKLYKAGCLNSLLHHGNTNRRKKDMRNKQTETWTIDEDIKSNDVVPDILESIGNIIKELLCEYEYVELDAILTGKNED